MLDRDRIVGKLDTLDGYLRELDTILPRSLEEYRRIEIRRACERLVQVAVECVIDTCTLVVAGLRLGLPAEEEDLFDKLEARGVISTGTRDTLRRMKGCRNILVHEYGTVADEIIFETITNRRGDFVQFKREILNALPRL